MNTFGVCCCVGDPRARPTKQGAPPVHRCLSAASHAMLRGCGGCWAYFTIGVGPPTPASPLARACVGCICSYWDAGRLHVMPGMVRQPVLLFVLEVLLAAARVL